MKTYNPTQGPYQNTTDGRDLVEWLEREFQGIKSALDTLHDMEIDYNRSTADGTRLKDREGMIRYAGPDAVAPYERASMPHWFDGTNWQSFASSGDVENVYQWVIDNFSVPGYGGLSLSTSGAVFPDIGAAWQKIDVFDQVKFSSPDAVVQNLTNSTLAIAEEGVWVLSVYFSMNHNESNSGREFSLRLYSETDGAPVAGETVIGVGRNQSQTNFSLSIPFDVASLTVNDEISLQIGGSLDTFTSVEFDSLDYSLHHVSAYAGEVAPEI